MTSLKMNQDIWTNVSSKHNHYTVTNLVCLLLTLETYISYIKLTTRAAEETICKVQNGNVWNLQTV